MTCLENLRERCTNRSSELLYLFIHPIYSSSILMYHWGNKIVVSVQIFVGETTQKTNTTTRSAACGCMCAFTVLVFRAVSLRAYFKCKGWWVSRSWCGSQTESPGPWLRRKTGFIWRRSAWWYTCRLDLLWWSFFLGCLNAGLPSLDKPVFYSGPEFLHTFLALMPLYAHSLVPTLKWVAVAAAFWRGRKYEHAQVLRFKCTL